MTDEQEEQTTGLAGYLDGMMKRQGNTQVFASIDDLLGRDEEEEITG
jgi:hypothetical protein